MQNGKRHVLTIDKPPLIRNVLNALVAGIESEGNAPPGICKRLEDFAKQGCDALLLNLRVVEEALDGTPAKIRNVRASLVGGVLVVACLVPTPWMLQIEELSRRRFFENNLISSLGAFVRALF
jgi:hypothetical protein